MTPLPWLRRPGAAPTPAAPADCPDSDAAHGETDGDADSRPPQFQAMPTAGSVPGASRNLPIGGRIVTSGARDQPRPFGSLPFGQ